MRPTSTTPRLFAVPAIAALAILASPLPVSACSCTNQLTLEQEFGYAAAVFSGRVISITPEPDGLHVLAMLEPIARWKGGIGATVPVYTPSNGGACGFPFEVDGEYLVFGSASDPSGPFFTHLCAKSSPLEGNVYVPLLGPPLIPTGTRSPSWGALKRFYR